MKPVKFGILGAGGIARRMARTALIVPEIEPYAIASRNAEKAEAYRAEYGFKKAYGSYEAMLSDPEVELVYVATPHVFHAAQAIEVLKAGKSVLVEKPFTVNAAEAEAVLSLSEQKGLFAGECMWPRFLPIMDQLREAMDKDLIGPLTGVSANVGYGGPRPNANPNSRGVLRELGAGALLDIGVYPLAFISLVFGDDVRSVQASALMNEDGVDKTETITLHYDNNRVATAFSTALARTDMNGYVYGYGGHIRVDDISNPHWVRIYTGGYAGVQQVWEAVRPEQDNGFEYELADAARCVAAGKAESTVYGHAGIRHEMQLLDEIRRQIGLVYPVDEK